MSLLSRINAHECIRYSYSVILSKCISTMYGWQERWISHWRRCHSKRGDQFIFDRLWSNHGAFILSTSSSSMPSNIYAMFIELIVFIQPRIGWSPLNLLPNHLEPHIWWCSPLLRCIHLMYCIATIVLLSFPSSFYVALTALLNVFWIEFESFMVAISVTTMINELKRQSHGDLYQPSQWCKKSIGGAQVSDGLRFFYYQLWLRSYAYWIASQRVSVSLILSAQVDRIGWEHCHPKRR